MKQQLIAIISAATLTCLGADTNQWSISGTNAEDSILLKEYPIPIVSNTVVYNLSGFHLLAETNEDSEVAAPVHEDSKVAAPVHIDKSMKDSAEAMNRQGFKMLAELVKEKRGSNVFFSPYSLDQVMAMAYVGANGKTATEFEAALGLPKNSGEFFRTASELMNAKYQTTEFLSSNSIWIEQTCRLKPAYLQQTQQYFSGQIFGFDKDAPDDAARRINDFVKENTKGKFDKVITQEAIRNDSAAILINTLYFKGRWQTVFKEQDTRDEEFHNAHGDFKTATMNMTEKFWYFETNVDLDSCRLQALAMPFRDGPFEMMVILPSGRTTISKTLSQLSAGMYDRIFKEQGSTHEVEIHLPKFDLESTMSLKRSLRQLGMNACFLPGADFSKMSGEPLYISSVKQKVKFRVDEKGAEAAAATWMFCELCSYPRKVFRADHPFVVLIRERNTGLVLFSGVVNDPRQ